jgi:hypothetical protein
MRTWDVSRHVSWIATASLAGAAIALFVTGAIGIAPGPAQARPEFAAKTGLPCGQCHVNPAGGGPNTAFGKAFKANGYNLPKKK